MVEISCERLILRDWRASDLAPWAAMNADPQLREHLGPLLSAEDSAVSVRTFQDDLDHHGFGFWAVEVRASAEFIGFTGLDTVDDGMPFCGVEAGWRLARSAWVTATPRRRPWLLSSTASPPPTCRRFWR
jgi:RimJ/RimL family protein N-acetyltransferase